MMNRIRTLIQNKKDEFYGKKELSNRTKALKKERKEIEERTKRREDFRKEKGSFRRARKKETESKYSRLKRSVENRPSFGRGFGGENSFGLGSSGGSSAFGLGKEKPKEEKKRNITIRIQQ